MSIPASEVIEKIRQGEVLRGKDLSGTGGTWRSAKTAAKRHHRQIGLESLSYLILVSTLVYLEHAPQLHWDHVNYLYTRPG